MHVLVQASLCSRRPYPRPAAPVLIRQVPDTSVHMAQLGALSAAGRSRSFDAAADGYGRGEGCVVLALRRSGEARDPGGHHSPCAVLRGACPCMPARHCRAVRAKTV